MNARTLLFATTIALLLLASGCTSRGLTITSEPPGAEVSVNRRVVGVTPIRVGFTHYGTYRIELRKEKFITMVKEEKISPPIYGYDPMAFVADNVIPARLNDETYLHYALKPLTEIPNRDDLLSRADLARAGQVTHPKSGVQYAINFTIERKVPVITGPSTESQLVVPVQPSVPVDPSQARPIDTPKPQGPTLSKEYNITDPSTGKPTQPTQPAVPKPVEKPDTRIPKEEQLQYEKTDLNVKKDKDGKPVPNLPSGAPTPPPAPGTPPPPAPIPPPATTPPPVQNP